MNEAWMLTFAVTVPFLCLGLLMWLARLEDTLGEGLEKPAATSDATPATAPAGSPAAATASPAATPAAPATVEDASAAVA